MYLLLWRQSEWQIVGQRGQSPPRRPIDTITEPPYMESPEIAAYLPRDARIQQVRSSARSRRQRESVGCHGVDGVYLDTQSQQIHSSMRAHRPSENADSHGVDRGQPGAQSHQGRRSTSARLQIGNVASHGVDDNQNHQPSMDLWQDISGAEHEDDYESDGPYEKQRSHSQRRHDSMAPRERSEGTLAGRGTPRWQGWAHMYMTRT